MEVNYPHLTPQAQLALFALLGLIIIFLGRRREEVELSAQERDVGRWQSILDAALAVSAMLACGYVVIQSQPAFDHWWLQGQSLGERAGLEQPLDIFIGIVGLVVVLEAARRSIGWTLPILSLLFLLYARWGPLLPDWLLPHRGYGVDRIVAQTFLHSQGVFGVALKVMFSYVFLFVLLGALLEATGATGYVIDAARRLFGRSTGGPAKVAVVSSGLMGSLSGSAVANTATTGTFTIPMMKSAGFAAHVAAGLEAAASAGGALVPPVMGAGAYMMLEIVEPPVTYLEIIRAALLPAILYYLSIFLTVHLRSQGIPRDRGGASVGTADFCRYEGLVFVAGLTGLVVFLVLGFSVFRAVSLAMGVVLVSSAVHPRTRIGARRLLEVVEQAARNGVALIGAAASVGIIIGVVTLTGIGARLPALILPLAQEHLLLALVALMVSSIVLGMGLPSAVCYLLLATIVGPVLGKLGVAPLAAHLFIFYFGLMSMVTPPVALAAYAASSIAGSKFLRSSVAAFRFSLVGFILPYLFVLRPALLMLAETGEAASVNRIILATAISAIGMVPLAAGLAGYFRRPLGGSLRLLLVASALVVMFPGPASLELIPEVNVVNLLGVGVALATLGRLRSTSA